LNRNVALVYVRISREDAEREKISPQMQLEMCRALPELAGLEVETFTDLGISGKDASSRPDYVRMLDRVARGDVKYVVAYDQSRITRNVSDLQLFRDALAKHHVLFLESSMRRLTDPEDEDQELGSNILGSVDQHYRKKVARRVRDALRSKVARGELVGPAPAGYVRTKRLLENGKIELAISVDPEKAPIVQLAFREYASGSYSLKSLARSLNSRNVQLPRAAKFRNNRPAAALWTADVLKDILTNPRYVGRIPRRDGQSFEASYPALIDSDTWAACERVRLRQRPQGWNAAALAQRKPTSRYLLSGVLRCRECGSTMSGETWKADRTHPTERYRYTCYRRRVAGGCAAPYVRQDEIEAQLLDALHEFAIPTGYGFVEAIDAATSAYLQTAKPKKASAKGIEMQLDRLQNRYVMGDLPEADYVARRDGLRADLAELQREKPHRSSADSARRSARSWPSGRR
jgi:DNA invertase Pin-like site-specific DNA recombinase